MDRLVHERQRVVRRVQVADRVVDVDRLDRVAGEEVDRVERLGQPQQVLVVGAVADPAAVVQVSDVGRAADRPERHPVATDPEVVGGIPGVERELGRGGLDRLGDHVRVEADALGAGLDGRPGRHEQVARLGVEEVHPDLGQDPERPEVDRLQLVGGDRLGRAVRHPRLGPRPLLGQGVASVALAAAGASASKALARRGVHVGHASSLPPVRSNQVVLSWV